MGVFADFSHVAREVGRLAIAGHIFPHQMRQAIEVEELEDKLRVVVGSDELYEIAQQWIAYRRTWLAMDTGYLPALRNEYYYAIRYGPHDVVPHPDKLSKAVD